MTDLTTLFSMMVRGDFACGQRRLYDETLIGSFATGMRGVGQARIGAQLQ